jgi:hypothetical protein
VKKTITDYKISFVYYSIDGSIFGSYKELNKPLASIEDVKNHYEIWNCPIVVKEGNFEYLNGVYSKK